MPVTNRLIGKSSLEIFFFIPNIVGYIRLLLIAVSWIYIEEPFIFLPLYILNVILDEVDGWTARRFNQVSSYGAWLDVVLDLIGRGMTWCFSYKYGYAIIAFEWLVFLGNTERANGKQWKESFDQAPRFVHWVMDDGYKKPLGAFAIIGLHVLPIWLYAIKMKVLESFSFPSFTVTVILLVARMVCGAVELWCLWKYVQLLLHRNPHKSVIDK